MENRVCAIDCSGAANDSSEPILWKNNVLQAQKVLI